MTTQGKEICRDLAAAGLREPVKGAQIVTYRDGETRVDWRGEDLEDGLSRCAVALRAAGWHVKQEPSWVCLVVTKAAPEQVALLDLHRASPQPPPLFQQLLLVDVEIEEAGRLQVPKAEA